MTVQNSKNNRRYFIKTSLAGVAAGVIFLWDKMVKTQGVISKPKNVHLTYNPNKKVSFNGNFIVVNDNNKTIVLSSKCTHLGCEINELKDNQLICPCHGSTYNLLGMATKGPATGSLKKMDFDLNKNTNSIIIKV